MSDLVRLGNIAMEEGVASPTSSLTNAPRTLRNVLTNMGASQVEQSVDCSCFCFGAFESGILTRLWFSQVCATTDVKPSRESSRPIWPEVSVRNKMESRYRSTGAMIMFVNQCMIIGGQGTPALSMRNDEGLPPSARSFHSELLHISRTREDADCRVSRYFGEPSNSSGERSIHWLYSSLTVQS